MTKIGVVPWAGETNPYQPLLYSALARLGDDWVRADDFGRLHSPVAALAGFRRAGVDVIHLHWPLWGPGRVFPGARLARLGVSAAWLTALRVQPMPLVWTIHNVVPHEPYTLADMAIARALASLAAAKIVHSDSTIESMHRARLSATNTHVVPHGAYGDAYPRPIPKAQARALLDWPQDIPVALFLGLIRPYKGIIELLESFRAIDVPAKLVIAGECLDASLHGMLSSAADAGDITYLPGFANADTASRLLCACDVVCMPYRRVVTSGSALLALSFRRPIVAPRSGTLADLPEQLGYFYAPGGLGDLTQALHRSLVSHETRPDDFEPVLGDYLRSISWNDIAARTHSVYEIALDATATRR